MSGLSLRQFFVYYREELKTLVVASKKLVVPVSGGGFQGGGGALHGGRFTTKQPRESTFGIRNRAGAKTVWPVPEAETA